jgi:quinol monooxygenase YgiN
MSSTNVPNERQEGVDVIVKKFLVIAASAIAFSVGLDARPEEAQRPYVRIAQLEVDPAQLESFGAAAREIGQISVRDEPGCLALYAVSGKDDPGRVTVFEIYRDSDAYKAHVQTPHFQRFRAATDAMVKSRKLMDAVPISLAAKPQ